MAGRSRQTGTVKVGRRPINRYTSRVKCTVIQILRALDTTIATTIAAAG